MLFFNPQTNNNFLYWSELKAFADNKINVAEELNFFLERVENNVEKGENAGYPNVFKSLLFQVGIVW